MRINWAPNPFDTTVELDDRDKQILLTAYQTEELTELIYDIDMLLQENDVETAKVKIGNWKRIVNMTVKNGDVDYLVQDVNDSHMGDCICEPCTCMRCVAESYLHINTLPGCGSHEARDIYNAFKSANNIDDAIKILQESVNKDFPKTKQWDVFSDEDYARHVARWREEYRRAAKWLADYKAKHNF